MPKTPWRYARNETIEGIYYNRLELPLWNTLFFPNHGTTIGHAIRLRSADKVLKMLYRLFYADDATPSATGWNVLKAREDMSPDEMPGP
jgi:hypothetical protein